MSLDDNGTAAALGGDSEFHVRGPRSPLVLVLAGLGILALGGAGLYRGLTSERAASAGPQGALTGAIVGASPAVALPHNPDWSTLSGPKVLPPPEVKPVKAAKADDDDDSAAPAPPAPAAADQVVTDQSPPTAPTKGAQTPDDGAPPL